MATAHLIHGYLGAGKTTFAGRLERKAGAVRFTPDDWMGRLFGDDPPALLFQDKAEAILGLMEPMWLRCLDLGVDVVLDYGFWRRSERDHVRDLAGGARADVMLYVLQCAEEEAMRRIEARTLRANDDETSTPRKFTLEVVR